MKIIKILGDVKAYLMEDGSKVPFKEYKMHVIQNRMRKNQIKEESEEAKPKKRTYKRRKK
jgi:hypothetical protein